MQIHTGRDGSVGRSFHSRQLELDQLGQVYRMQHSEVLKAIRRLIQMTFQELGAPGAQDLSENILLRDNYYCGRRFTAGDLQAVWFVEEGEIKFYGKGGGLLKVNSTADARQYIPVESRKAA